MFKYRFVLLIPIFTLFSFSLSAQDNDMKNYNLVTNSNTIGLGFVNILDPYLSPFEYSGNSIEYTGDYREYISTSDTTFSISSRFLVQLGKAKHPANINSMFFFNGNYEFGYYYHYRPEKNLTCLFGTSWDVDLGGKYIARNINNPFSLDLYTDLNLSISTNYKFKLQVFSIFSQDFRLEYGVKTPLVGCMFVPPQGKSYYQIFSLGDYTDVFHLSSLHNKRAFYQYFNLDVPLNFSTFRIGVKSDLLQYKANDVVYHSFNYSVNLGCVINFYVFEGIKNKAPKNFRSSY